MTKPLKDEDRILHMLDAARKAADFVRGRNRVDLDKDEKLALAVIHLLEIVGEAASNVSADLCRRYPDIPWKKIAGTRNRLAHGYFDVDLDIVWQIATTQLPPLILELKKIVFPI